MRILKAINTSRSQVLAERVKLADNFFTRLQGLLCTPALPPGQGLLLLPCNSIHSIGMTYAIDAIFLDEQNSVVGLIKNFKPGRLSTIYPRAHSCLELPAGSIAASGTSIDDKLEFQNL